MLVKSTLTRWLYQNYYNITVPQILLGCIIAIMMASAIKKLSSSGKAEATLKTTDNPLKEFPFLKILSAVVLIGAVVLRIWCKRQYDYDPFIYSVILLLAEAACIVFNVDWKICTALYVLYGLCNANDIIDLFRPNTWSYFLKLSSAGFQVTITAVLGGLVTLWVIYQGIKKTKSK